MGKRVEMQKRLRAVWDHATPINSDVLAPTAWRFVPRSLTGGHGWGVYDRMHDRFLNDNEVLGFSVEALATETVPGLTN